MNEKEVKSGKKSISDDVIIEKIDKEGNLVVIDPNDPRWFEIVDYKGEEAKHFPYTGAYISVKTGRIMGNEGGRKDFDGSAMVTLGNQQRREAVIDALTIVAIEKGLGSVPTATLVEIIKKRIEVAIESDSRAGNDAAKLILGLTDFAQQESSENRPQVRIDIHSEEYGKIIKKLLEL